MCYAIAYPPGLVRPKQPLGRTGHVAPDPGNTLEATIGELEGPRGGEAPGTWHRLRREAPVFVPNAVQNSYQDDLILPPFIPAAPHVPLGQAEAAERQAEGQSRGAERQGVPNRASPHENDEGSYCTVDTKDFPYPRRRMGVAYPTAEHLAEGVAAALTGAARRQARAGHPLETTTSERAQGHSEGQAAAEPLVQAAGAERQGEAEGLLGEADRRVHHRGCTVHIACDRQLDSSGVGATFSLFGPITDIHTAGSIAMVAYKSVESARKAADSMHGKVL